MECDDGSEISSGFTAAEKTKLWDRWQRGRSKRLGERLVSRHHLFIIELPCAGDLLMC